MHHPVLLLLLLLVALLLGPVIGQGLTALGDLVGPLISTAPGVMFFTRLAAPAMVALVLMLGVAVVAVMKLVFGV